MTVFGDLYVTQLMDIYHGQIDKEGANVAIYSCS